MKETAVLNAMPQNTENRPPLRLVDMAVDRMPGVIRGKVQRIMDGDGSLENVEAELERLSEGRYLSPRKLDKLLRGLPGVDVSLPEHEIQHLESLLPRELSSEASRRIRLLQENTEGNIPPLIQQIPAIYMVDGLETDFTLASFLNVWDRAMLSDDDENGAYEIRLLDERVKVGDFMLTRPRWTRSNMVHADLTENVTEKTKHKVWQNRKLRAYTPRSLKRSKGKIHSDQVQYQREILGNGSEIDTSSFIALLFRNLASGQRVVLADGKYQGMRLNDTTSEGPYYIALYNNKALYMDDSFRGLASEHGIGASFEIS